MKKWHVLQVSVISIPQLSRIYRRGWKEVASENVAAHSQENGRVLDMIAELLTSNHLVNIPVPIQSTKLLLFTLGVIHRSTNKLKHGTRQIMDSKPD